VRRGGSIFPLIGEEAVWPIEIGLGGMEDAEAEEIKLRTARKS
jgi:hypothetical protein